MIIIMIFLVISLTANNTSAFDIIGLQPVAPKGVFTTFSAESISKNKFSFELGTDISRAPDFYRFALKGAYGISDVIEFNFMIPYVFKFMDSIDGLEDVSIGVKHRFYNEGKYGPSMAYLFHASIPSGQDKLSTEGRFGLGLVISKRVSPFNVHLNMFYSKPGTGRLTDEISLSAGIESSASHNFNLLGEILAKRSHFTDKFNLIETRFGYRIQTADYLYTTFGVGFDLKNRNPEFRIFLSMSITSPYGKKKIKKIYEEE
jgi:hypothetical protein